MYMVSMPPLSKISLYPHIPHVPICGGCSVSNSRLLLLVPIPTQPYTPALCELEEEMMRQVPMDPHGCPCASLDFQALYNLQVSKDNPAQDRMDRHPGN